MRILFWGSPSFAVPSLQTLLGSRHTLVGLVTQPDRPRGRSGRPQPPPTKEALQRAGRDVPVLQPLKPADRGFQAGLAELEPDVSVVAAYGNLLPARLLKLPRLGSVNVHASLLPRHRGAAPVAAALLAGDRVTGITLMRMDRGLDTGPVLLQRRLEIGSQESCGELTDRLAHLGAAVLMEGLDRLEVGGLTAIPQREEEATYAARVTPEQARIRWEDSALAIERALRAYDPWPGAFTLWQGKRLKLFRARPVTAGGSEAARVLSPTPAGTLAVGERPASDPPPVGPAPSAGRAAGEAGERRAEPALYVRAGDGVLEILDLQLEGRPRMSAAAFLQGRRIPAGARLA